MAKPKKFTFGVIKNVSWLVLIARELNYFKAQNLNLDFRYGTTGKHNMEMLKKGWLDFASLLDTNIAYLGFEKKWPAKVVGCMQQKHDEALLVRGDRQIKQPNDLYGKTIGYLPRTSSHMFLVQFLKHHQIDTQSLNLVELSLEQMIAQLVSGEIDAISAWEPYLFQARYQLAQQDMKTIKFDGTGLYKFSIVLAATPKVLSKYPAELNSVFTALSQAEQFVRAEPVQAKAIVAANTTFDPLVFDEVWDLFELKLQKVPADFIDNVEQHGQWIIESEPKFKSRELPNYWAGVDDEIVAPYISTHRGSGAAR